MEEKKALRNKLILIREEISDKEKVSLEICRKISLLELSSEDTNILIYYPFKGEVNPYTSQ